MEKENSFAGVLTKLNELKKLLKRNHDTPLNFVQAAQYLSISHSHLYKMTSQRKIPFHKPSGKYLYFFKDELDLWITNNEGENKQKLGDSSQKSGEKEEEEPP